MRAHSSRHFPAQGERAVRFRPGTALLYRMDVWHRGTPVLEGATRYTHHIGIRHADAMCGAAERSYAKEQSGKRQDIDIRDTQRDAGFTRDDAGSSKKQGCITTPTRR